MCKLLISVVLVALIIFSSCSNFTVIGPKVYQNCVGNLTPCINGTFTIGNPTHWFDSAYIEHLYTANGTVGASNVTTPGGTLDYLAKFNTATNIVNSSIKSNATANYFGADFFTDRWTVAPSPMNTFVGMGVAGAGNIAHTAPGDGDSNTAVGWNSAHDITTGKFNTAVGDQSLTNVSTGIGNTAVGEVALGGVVGSSFNTGVGADVLWQNDGSYNTAIGVFAGGNNLAGVRNVFVGYSAGQNELGSDTLYIDNTNTATPLIYGYFATNNVTVYNNFTVAQFMTLGTPVWDDMQISFSNAKAPASNAPNWVAYKNSEVPAFSKTATNVLYFTAQLPHSYKEGSNMDFHIHITYPDAGVGNSTWYFTYSWANIDGTFPGASNSGNVIIPSHATADYNDMAEIMGTINGAGKTVSSILLCSISRLGGDGSDNYDNVIYLVSGDFHVQRDTIGSKQQLVK
jgi:hypothetical protein